MCVCVLSVGARTYTHTDSCIWGESRVPLCFLFFKWRPPKLLWGGVLGTLGSFEVSGFFQPAVLAQELSLARLSFAGALRGQSGEGQALPLSSPK